MAKISQKQRVIKYIKDFGSITTFQAYSDLGVTRLSAVMYNIKKDGIKVKTETGKAKNRYGEDTHFAIYSFIEQDEEIMKLIPSMY